MSGIRSSPPLRAVARRPLVLHRGLASSRATVYQLVRSWTRAGRERSIVTTPAYSRTTAAQPFIGFLLWTVARFSVAYAVAMTSQMSAPERAKR